MDAQTLQRLIAQGMGRSAAKTGETVTVYRPRRGANPLDPANEIMMLPAIFRSADGGTRVSRPDQPYWQGDFDFRLTRPGDYLVGQPGIFYIAEQRIGLPVICVLANRTVTLVRPAATQQGGYSGLFASQATAILLNWPGSLLESEARVSASRQGAGLLGSWTLLLPVLPAAPQAEDIVTDTCGRSFVTLAAENNDWGWRLALRQISA